MADARARLTAGMVYLATEGESAGDDAHGPLALQLVEVARADPDGLGCARVRLEGVAVTARVLGDLWAVVVHRRDYHHSASDSARVLAGLLNVNRA